MRHLTSDDMRRLRSTGDPADRNRLLAHLAECEACAERLHDADEDERLDFTPLDQARREELTALGHAAYRSADAPGRAGSRSMAWAIAGLAAAAVLMLTIVPDWRGSRPLTGPTDPSVRGGTIQLLEPLDTAHPPLVFAWSSASAGGDYELVVRDDRGDAVWTARTTGTRLEPPPDVSARFAPGRRFTWQLTARDSAGVESHRSASRGFVVAPPQ